MRWKAKSFICFCCFPVQCLTFFEALDRKTTKAGDFMRLDFERGTIAVDSQLRGGNVGSSSRARSGMSISAGVE